MRDVTYLKICIITSLVTFFHVARFDETGWRISTASYFFAADALGMGAFCVMGAEAPLEGRRSSLCRHPGVSYCNLKGESQRRALDETSRGDLLHATIDGAEKSWYALPALFGSSVYVFLQTCCGR